MAVDEKIGYAARVQANRPADLTDASSVHLGFKWLVFWLYFGAIAVLKSLLRALLMAAAETEMGLMALSDMQSKSGITSAIPYRSGNKSALLGAIIWLTE